MVTIFGMGHIQSIPVKLLCLCLSVIQYCWEFVNTIFILGNFKNQFDDCPYVRMTILPHATSQMDETILVPVSLISYFW